MEKLCKATTQVKIPDPVCRKIIAPAGETADRGGEGVATAEGERQQPDPAPALPGGAKAQGDDCQIKNDQEQVVPFQRPIPRHPVQIDRLEEAMIRLDQRQNKQAVDLGSQKMIGNETKYKNGVFQREFDQYTTEPLPLKVKTVDVEIARVRILAGDHLILERGIKGELTCLKIIVNQPGKDRDEKTKKEEKCKKIKRLFLPAKHKKSRKQN